MGKLNEARKQEAQKLRLDGLSITEISKILHTNPGTISILTRDIELSLDQKERITQKSRKYQYNNKLFEVPNEISYYLLGAFYADGNVSKTGRKMSIASKDQGWLETISKIMTKNKPLQKMKKSNCYVLEINNKNIVDWFKTNGCIPAKSLTIQFPNIPQKYMSHFMRGVFDGDGSITIFNNNKKNKNLKTQMCRINIVSASEYFINGISNLFNNLNIKHNIFAKEHKQISIFGQPPKNYNTAYYIYFNGKQAVQFCQFIYENKNIFLDRKYERYQEYLKIRECELENNYNVSRPFKNPQHVINLLKNKTYNEVAAILKTTPTTIVIKLKALNLWKPRRKY